MKRSINVPYHVKVTETPTPIPAEGALTDDAGGLSDWNSLPIRNRRRKRRGPYPLWMKYLGWCVGLAALVTGSQLAVHAVRSDPRDARVYAERELRLNVLKQDEHVVKEVNVWQRPPIDYFRATRGVLALTEAPGDSANPVGAASFTWDFSPVIRSAHPMPHQPWTSVIGQWTR